MVYCYTNNNSTGAPFRLTLARFNIIINKSQVYTSNHCIKRNRQINTFLWKLENTSDPMSSKQKVLWNTERCSKSSEQCI